MIDIDRFKWRLAETIVWCMKAVSIDDPQNSLRSCFFRPPSFWYPHDLYNAQTIVDRLAEERARRLKERDWRGRDYPDAPANGLAGGRLLVYHPYANLADGAAEAESYGFFSIDNEPPWDTWLAFFSDGKDDLSYGSYLLAWVPPQMIDLANAGINVNPEVCILWATDLETPSIRMLKDVGLFS